MYGRSPFLVAQKNCEKVKRTPILILQQFSKMPSRQRRKWLQMQRCACRLTHSPNGAGLSDSSFRIAVPGSRFHSRKISSKDGCSRRQRHHAWPFAKHARKLLLLLLLCRQIYLEGSRTTTRHEQELQSRRVTGSSILFSEAKQSMKEC